MRDQLNRPKRFGEVLDVIFSLSRNHFKDFLKIFLIIIGPIILLEMFIQLSMGKSFFRDLAAGGNWFEQILNTFADEEMLEVSLEESLANLFIVMLTSFFGVFATISVLYLVDHLRKGEDYELSNIIKKSFTKFLPIVAASILLFAFVFGFFILISIIALIIGLALDSLPNFLAILFIFLLIVAVAVLMIYFGIRLSFYLAKIAFDQPVLQSFQESWKITKGRTLFIFGIYLIFILIISVVLNVFEVTLGLTLGNSVLFNLLINLVSLVITMIGTVGYAVVYFDLQARFEASDLKLMLEEYEEK